MVVIPGCCCRVVRGITWTHGDCKESFLSGELLMLRGYNVSCVSICLRDWYDGDED